jgi:hypothetical protein
MKKTKVILLRGKKDSGKTTTMNLVYWELKQRGYTDSLIRLQPDANNLGQDILLVLEWQGKKIGIVSNGDDYLYVEEMMRWFHKLKVTLIVGCTRSRNVAHSSFRTCIELEEEQIIQIVHEERKERTTDKAQQTKSSHKVAIRMADKVDEIIKQ